MSTMPTTARMMTSGFLLVDAPLDTLAELTVSS
jgi:hypothetical protein